MLFADSFVVQVIVAEDDVTSLDIEVIFGAALSTYTFSLPWLTAFILRDLPFSNSISASLTRGLPMEYWSLPGHTG